MTTHLASLCVVLLAALPILAGCAGAPAPAPATPTTPPPSLTSQPPTATVTPTTEPSATATPPPTEPPTPSTTPTRTPQATATPIDVTNLPQGEWVRLQGMPTARSEMAAAQVDGIIYVPGGYPNGGLTFTSSNLFEAFNPAENRWMQRARLPDERDHLMTTAHNGLIYLFGGYNNVCGCDPSPETFGYNAWSYDPATDRWTTLAPMPEMRVAGAAVSLGEFIYIVGGWGEDTTLVTLRYDPVTNTWATLAPLNEPREHTNAVVLDGLIYALGGRWETDDLRSVEIYDPATDTWTRSIPMRDARAGHAAAVVGGRIYVMGGELILSRLPEELVNSAEVYDPATNRWQRFDMPQGVHGVTAATVGDVLYMLGGSTRAGGVNNNGNVWAYRP